LESRRDPSTGSSSNGIAGEETMTEGKHWASS
jgi:hypothetical protein